MSRSLRSMDPAERDRAITRRLSVGDNAPKGLGYWGAKDALDRKGKKREKSDDPES